MLRGILVVTQVKRMPPKPWKTVSSRSIYTNKWLRLREDLAELPNGHTTIYGVVSTGACVGVLPFVDDQHVLMVRQYRYVFGENQRWEMPTGGMHAGESPEQAAQRELGEEAGYRAERLKHVCTYHTSKSILEEVAHLYLGFGLTAVAQTPDETEFFEQAVLRFDEVLELVLRSEIRDGMTVIAVLHAARLRGSFTT
jgi:ADP-ribose pyrophosphatase